MFKAESYDFSIEIGSKLIKDGKVYLVVNDYSVLEY